MRKAAPETLNNLTLIGDAWADRPLYRCCCGIQKEIPRAQIRPSLRSCGCLKVVNQKKAKKRSQRPMPWYLPTYQTPQG